MRTVVLCAALASMSWTLAGCGEASSPPASSPASQAEREKKYPGVPTEGPEAAKAKASRKK